MVDAIVHEPPSTTPVDGSAVMHNPPRLGDERQDKSEFVEPARLRFTHLRSLALDPDESVALIERVANDVVELRGEHRGVAEEQLQHRRPGVPRSA